jgi:hypothetical protein
MEPWVGHGDDREVGHVKAARRILVVAFVVLSLTEVVGQAEAQETPMIPEATMTTSNSIQRRG